MWFAQFKHDAVHNEPSSLFCVMFILKIDNENARHSRYIVLHIGRTMYKRVPTGVPGTRSRVVLDTYREYDKSRRITSCPSLFLLYLVL